MDKKSKQESKQLFERAKRSIPGGVNSPVRAFNAVGGDPVYIKSASGSRLITEDGDELLDFCGSWGPLILGHAREEVVAAVQRAAAEGLSFGANTRKETEFCELICECIDHMDMVRLVNSGTEAVMSAVRLARGFTGRQKIVKFDGCYHGHSDGMLAAAGSGVLHSGTSSSAGVAESVVADVHVAPYNDTEAVRTLVREFGGDIAAIIAEPIAGNMGLVQPVDGFLAELRRSANDCGALLIFDEVITGFRFGPTSYGQICGVEPDLTTLGKIIGGGMPIGAVGGRSEIMRHFAPLGQVYQAGTLSGNPVAVAAGLKTLNLLRDENPYPLLAELGSILSEQINRIAAEHDAPMHCAQTGGVFTTFCRKEPVRNLDDAKSCDQDMYARYFHHLLDNGIYTPPSPFEVNFISSAHWKEDIAKYVERFASWLAKQNRE